eukprot:TRINITY_DN39814_c0_g1_i1.p1 TRINITY_DN39814_c0_g1~~TRINITY_DN39814_c0_g1_i1.p1  ORF type:complete len:294 (+),score=79.56 TRINITY_DN39814_c0_g1_i1:56-937(+)
MGKRVRARRARGGAGPGAPSGAAAAAPVGEPAAAAGGGGPVARPAAAAAGVKKRRKLKARPTGSAAPQPAPAQPAAAAAPAASPAPPAAGGKLRKKKKGKKPAAAAAAPAAAQPPAASGGGIGDIFARLKEPRPQPAPAPAAAAAAGGAAHQFFGAGGGSARVTGPHRGYIPAGGNLEQGKMTVEEATRRALKNRGCLGFTFEGPPGAGGKAMIWLKDKWPAKGLDEPGGRWVSYRVEGRQKMDDDFLDLRGEGRMSSKRRSKDGLPLVAADALNLGGGGNTALCPFDCDCCH